MLPRPCHVVRRFAAYLLAAASIGSFALAGDTLRIAGDGSEDYFSVADAFAAAQDGDTLLVIGDPLDTNFDVVGKGVTLVNVSAPGWSPEFIGIRDIAAGSTMIMRGIVQVTGFLFIEDCAGAVLVTDSTLIDTKVTACQGVAFSRCEMMADDSYDTSVGVYGAPGLWVEDAKVLFESCQLQGAEGDGAWCGSGICQTCCVGGGNGLPGLFIRGASEVRAQASTLRGGAAGQDNPSCNCPIFAVGYGYSVVSPGALVLIETPTLSNTGDAGFATILPVTPREATFPQSVAAGATFTGAIEGDLGDTVFLLGGGVFAFRSNSVLSGILQINGSGGRRRILSLPPSGTGTVTLTAPVVPPGEVFRLPLQMVFLRPNGEVRFAPASIVEVRGPGVPAW